ncbi:MAG TPA: phage protein Gp36 family protein [Vicinamibacterales bacterium]|nr:phage protein Gp36 family protein [Vicinamibacterales bacterium]
MATFTPPEYFTQAEAEARHGVEAVRQLFDDDGDHAGDSGTVTWGIREASGEVDAFLFGKFSSDVIANLKDDYRFKGCAIDVFMAIGGKRRREFTDAQGRTPYTADMKDAFAKLESIGKGLTRLGAENVHGQNPTLRGRISVDTSQHNHIFAPSRHNRIGPGSF